jgi:hypothetical protein
MSATAAGISFADVVIAPFKMTRGYAEALTKDIPADKFASMPHPTMNHPAFIIGHLSIYPNRLFQILGKPEKVVEKAGFADLFAAGKPCVDQPGHYPHKDEIVSYFFERYQAIADEVATLPDETFLGENPMQGRMKELLPNLGSALIFMLHNHTMMHLGQLSAWRRAMGLPSAM